MQNIAFSDLPPSSFEADIWHFLQKDARPIVVYGMGNGADKLAARLSSFGKEIADFFASDEFVRGQFFRGKQVLSLAQIEEKYPDFIILVSFGSHLSHVVDAVYALAEKHTLLIPDLPLAGEDYFDAAFYRKNYEKIKRVFALLQDERSREIFASVVWYKLTGETKFLKRAVYTEDKQVLLGCGTIRRAVDVGAYRGDTLADLHACAPNLCEVIAVEPDRKNFAKLQKVADSLQTETFRVECCHAAAWNEDGFSAFAESGNRNATLLHTTLKTSFEHKEEEIRTAKIDTILSGRKTDYIKYDTEGAEAEALFGTFKTIQSCAPYLLVSAYHKSEDIFSLPLLLAESFPQKYTYYYRRSHCFPAWELDLIAVPNERTERGI